MNLVRQADRVEYPLTFNQREMWAQCLLNDDVALNNVAMEVTLDGRLDVGALRTALAAAIDRHEAMRTSFPMRYGVSRQRVEPIRTDFALRDLSYASANERRAVADERVEALIQQPFNLDRAPLFRAELLRLDDRHAILAFVFHHLIVDGYHVSQLIEDLVCAYRAAVGGDRHSLPPLRFQYGDFAVWQERALAAGEFDQHEPFWQRQLYPSVPEEPPSRDRQPVSARFQNRSVTRSLSPALSDSLTALAAYCQTTRFRIVTAAFAVLAGRIADRHELVLAMPFSIKPAEMEDAAGMFANTLPIRVTLDLEAGFDRLIANTTALFREARARREFPLVRVLRGPAPTCQAKRSPMPFCVSQVRRFATDTDDLRIGTSVPFLRMSPFDLWLIAATDRPCIELRIQYAVDLFDRAEVVALGDDLESLLAEVVASPATPIGRLKLGTVRHRTLVAAPSAGLPQERVG